MKLVQRFRYWWAMRGKAVLFILAILVLSELPYWLEKSGPKAIHSIALPSQSISVLWIDAENYSRIATNGSSIIFAIPFTGDVEAINIHNGGIVWKVELPPERGGARELLANQEAVFVVTSIFLDAYKITTGELMWSTKLGDGHVSIFLQLDDDLLRVYYGDQIIEVDTKTGKIINVISNTSTVWVQDNIILQKDSSNYLIGLNKQSGDHLWIGSVYIGEGHNPLEVGNEGLIVSVEKGICKLNLKTGRYNWCHPEIDISNIAINEKAQVGYAIQDDIRLVTLNLNDGKIMSQEQFLSNQPNNNDQGTPVTSVAFSDGVVVISFSDSEQTFGLDIKNFK